LSNAREGKQRGNLAEQILAHFKKALYRRARTRSRGSPRKGRKAKAFDHMVLMMLGEITGESLLALKGKIAIELSREQQLPRQNERGRRKDPASPERL